MRGELRALRLRRAWARRPLAVEPLECRALLAVSPLGDPIVVESHATQARIDPQTAMDAAGNFVVVWQADVADGSGMGIFARRYAADGTPLSGAIQVNTTTAGNQTRPRVAMNDDGAFVIVWQFTPPSTFGGQVFAQRFDAAGNKLGGELLVGNPLSQLEREPAVAINDNGAFVVTWVDGFTLGRINFRRYDSAGTPASIQEAALAGTSPEVGIDAEGNFVVAWSISTFARFRRFYADGTSAAPEVSLSGMPIAFGSTPHVAMNDAGAYVLGIQGNLLQAVTFDRTGAQRHVIDVAQFPNFGAGIPEFAVAIDDGGNLGFGMIQLGAGVWQMNHWQFDADGSPVGATIVHSGPFATVEDEVHLATNADGRSVVVFLPTAGTVTAQRLQENDLRVTSVANSLGEQIANESEPITAVAGLEVIFSRTTSTAGGSAGLSSVTNPDNWLLFKNDADISAQIVGITYDGARARLELANPLGPGSYRLVARDDIQTPEGVALDGDEDQLPGGEFVFVFAIGTTYAVGAPLEFANPVGYRAIDVARNSTGQILAAWISISPSTTITVQHLDSQGVPTSAPIVVADLLDTPPVIDSHLLDDGGFVLAWTTLAGAVLRRFAADGTPISAVLPVGFTSYNVRFDVAADGTIATANGSTVHVVPGDGSPSHFFVVPNLVQYMPDVAFLSNDELVVTWSEPSQNGDVVAQRFNLLGVAQGPLINVGSRIGISAQPIPTVELDPDGGFVIAWQGFAPEINSSNLSTVVRARIFEADGSPRTDVFRVDQPFATNLTAATFRSWPEVAFDGKGHFMVGWHSFNADGNQFGILTRTYYADGTPLGNQRRLNLDGNGSQERPSLATDADGNFLAAWVGPRLHAQQLRIYDPAIVDLNGNAAGTDREQVVPSWDAAISLGDQFVLRAGESATLVSAQIVIRNALPGDLVIVDTGDSSLSTAFVDGVLTISGNGPLELYEQVLRTATFTADASRVPGFVDFAFTTDDGTLTSPAAVHRVTNYVPGSATIAGRHVFYNGSKFDRTNLFINPADDAAVAPDKSAYLPGSGPAAFANVSSYSRGINGIMLDLAGDYGDLTLDDFTFKMGANNAPGSWADAPAPDGFLIRPGAGADGADRIVISWTGTSIKNTWLEVTLAASGNTGLAAPDVFYFGSRVGDTGLGTTPTAVATNASDAIAARNNTGAGSAITNIFDFDRSGAVTGSDEIAARNNTGAMVLINIAATPEALAAVPATATLPDTGALSAIAQALSAPAKLVEPLSAPRVEVPRSVTSSAALSPPAVAAAWAAVGQKPESRSAGDWAEDEADDWLAWPGVELD